MSSATLCLDNTIENEQALFLSTIYHDGRGGFGKRFIFPNDEKKQPQGFVTKDYSRLSCSDRNHNIYVSLCTLKGNHCTQEQVFNRSVLYIDIDLHDDTTDINGTKPKILECLNKAYASGLLPIPTIVNDSGRGFAVYYVLDRSIAMLSGNNNQLRLFDNTYRSLFNAYEYIVAGMADVDSKVMKANQIVRLPGTRNMTAGTLCKMIFFSGDFYTLSSLRKALSRISSLASKKENIIKHSAAHGVIVNYTGARENAFLFARISRLRKLAALRHDQSEGWREMLLFICYNAAKRIYDRASARNVIIDINQQFRYPLPEAEVEHAIKSSAQGRTQDGGSQGFYKYSEIKIIEKLKVTEEENRICHFGSSCLKELQRSNRKEEHRLTKQARTNRVIELIANTDMTYDAIASTEGISLSTVKRIAKANNISRYNHAQKSDTPNVKKSVHIEAPTLKPGKDDNRSLTSAKKDTAWSPVGSLPAKVSFCALKSFDVLFDNPFVESEEADDILRANIAMLPDESERNYWTMLIALRKKLLPMAIADYIFAIKSKKIREQLDQELVGLVTQGKSIDKVLDALREWWDLHNPELRARKIRDARKARYEQYLNRRYADETSSIKSSVVDSRFDEADKELRNMNLSVGMVKKYYFRILKTAKQVRMFYSISEIGDLDGQSVVSVLKDLSVQDLVTVAIRASQTGRITYSFAWYLKAFLTCNSEVIKTA